MRIVPQKQLTEKVTLPGLDGITFEVKVFDFSQYSEFIDMVNDQNQDTSEFIDWLLSNGIESIEAPDEYKNEDGNLILPPRAMDVLAGKIQNINLVTEIKK